MSGAGRNRWCFLCLLTQGTSNIDSIGRLKLNNGGPPAERTVGSGLKLKTEIRRRYGKRGGTVAADEAARRRGSREAVRREAAMRACGAAGHHGESRMVRLNDAGSRRGVRGFAVRAQPAGSRPPQPSVSTRPHVWRRGTACVRADVSLALARPRRRRQPRHGAAVHAWVGEGRSGACRQAQSASTTVFCFACLARRRPSQRPLFVLLLIRSPLC
jgi:hypothetical protein